MILKDYIWRAAVKIVSSFEGAGFTDITGNFDGAYLSIGMIQWNFGQGTLQPLFKRMFNEHMDVAVNAMGGSAYNLKAAMGAGKEKQWALDIQSNNKVVEPYLSRLKNLCRTKEFQNIQIDAMSYYRDKAVSMCEQFKLYTDRAFVLMFDIAVNNGSVKNPPPLEGLSYEDKLRAIAESAARQKGKWYEDSMVRKTCIINGGGVVHEDTYEFNFTDGSAFQDIVTYKEMLGMFNDEAEISLWAKEAVDKLVELGIIKGDNLGNFNPHDPVSREAIAVVLYNTLKYLGKV
jgi:hypothetical protein